MLARIARRRRAGRCRHRARTPDARGARDAGWRRRPRVAALSACRRASRSRASEATAITRAALCSVFAARPGAASRTARRCDSNSAWVHGSAPRTDMTRSTAAATQSPLTSPRSMSPAAIARRSALSSLRTIDERVGAPSSSSRRRTPPLHYPLLQLRCRDDAEGDAVADVEQRRVRVDVDPAAGLGDVIMSWAGHRVPVTRPRRLLDRSRGGDRLAERGAADGPDHRRGRCRRRGLPSSSDTYSTCMLTRFDHGDGHRRVRTPIRTRFPPCAVGVAPDLAGRRRRRRRACRRGTPARSGSTAPAVGRGTVSIVSPSGISCRRRTFLAATSDCGGQRGRGRWPGMLPAKPSRAPGSARRSGHGRSHRRAARRARSVRDRQARRHRAAVPGRTPATSGLVGRRTPWPRPPATRSSVRSRRSGSVAAAPSTTGRSGGPT